MTMPMSTILLSRILCNPIDRLTENPSKPSANVINNNELKSLNGVPDCMPDCLLAVACTTYARMDMFMKGLLLSNDFSRCTHQAVKYGITHCVSRNLLRNDNINIFFVQEP